MKNKLKIRIDVSSLATKHISGVGNYTLLLTEALAKDENIQVEPVFFNFLNRQTTPSLKMSTKKNSLVPLRVYSKLASYGLAPHWDIFKKSVDLTIFPNFALWPTLKTRLTATTIHDLTYLYYPDVVEAKNLEFLKRVVPQAISKSDLIFTVSAAVKNEIIKEFRVEPNKIIVIHVPPNVAFEKRVELEDMKEVLSKYQIKSKYIYFLGNFEPRKNLERLIEAYQILPENIKRSYALILAGGKGWKSEAADKALTQAIQNGENIKHIGYINQEDSPALYQGADLFVMPSIYEGFGIPILEANMSKCPVIASDIPVLRETAGDSALFFNPDSPEGIAKTILEVLKNTETQRYLKLKGEQNLSRFSWQKNIASIKEAIYKLENSR